MHWEAGLGAVLFAVGFGTFTLGPHVLQRRGMLEPLETVGRRRLRWLLLASLTPYLGGLWLLASAAGVRVAVLVGVGALVFLHLAMIPFYVRDYRRATRRARAQREARARRKAAES